jgi:DNA-directed RNA polymerase specialized sigma24 family protein
MSFPNTQASLIIRLAQGGSETDWQQFLADYWGPIARFAARVGGLPLDQAEDVAGEAFVVLVRSPLFARWQAEKSGRLRGLLCGVVRNLLSNRRRVEKGRRRLLTAAADAGGMPEVLSVSPTAEPATEDLDTFYRAWVDELLARTMRKLLDDYQAAGKGDYFRALYGKVCEGLPAAEIAAALEIPVTSVENYVRAAKVQLSRRLADEVRGHVERYSPADSILAEFEGEWARLHEYLEKFGGLEEAIRQEAASLDTPRNLGESPSFMATSAQLQEATNERKDRG